MLKYKEEKGESRTLSNIEIDVNTIISVVLGNNPLDILRTSDFLLSKYAIGTREDLIEYLYLYNIGNSALTKKQKDLIHQGCERCFNYVDKIANKTNDMYKHKIVGNDYPQFVADGVGYLICTKVSGKRELDKVFMRMIAHSYAFMMKLHTFIIYDVFKDCQYILKIEDMEEGTLKSIRTAAILFEQKTKYFNLYKTAKVTEEDYERKTVSITDMFRCPCGDSYMKFADDYEDMALENVRYDNFYAHHYRIDCLRCNNNYDIIPNGGKDRFFLKMDKDILEIF